MTDEPQLYNTNRIWTKLLVELLVRHGVRRAILSPGGRASALAMALVTSPDILLSNYIDERVSGFRALGRLMACEEPVALCTTSGSAVVNVLPALAEAHARLMPIVLITCDRPFIYRKLHPPQFVDQLAICRPFVFRQLDCCDPDQNAIEHFRCQLQDILSLIKNNGPVHINLPQWGTYCALEYDPVDPVITITQTHKNQSNTVTQCSKTCSTHSVRSLLRDTSWPNAKRALVIVGPHPPCSRPALLHFAQRTAIPLLAGLASGLRRPSPPEFVFANDMQSDFLNRLSPDAILRIGRPPVSSYLQQWLSKTAADVIHLVSRGKGPDSLNPGATVLEAGSGDEILSELGACAPSIDKEWRDAWRGFSERNMEVSSLALSFMSWGELAAIGSIVNHPACKLLCISNSLSIQLAEMTALPWNTEQKIIVNRGVNGIDGTISTFLGFLEEYGGHGVCVLGDQALQHDLSALATLDHRKHKGAICVIDNRGPGIFQFSMGCNLSAFRHSMCITPSMSYEHLASLFGLGYHRCTDCDSLDNALCIAAKDTALHMIHCDIGESTIKSDLSIFSKSHARLSVFFSLKKV